MIVKPRSYPINLRKLKALKIRIPRNHPKEKEIKEDFAKNSAGYKGERELDYPLSFLLGDVYSILHDLRLFSDSYHFQIDALLLSPRFLLIIEVKNFSGTITFDSEFTQVIRSNAGKEKAFFDPILQVEAEGSIKELAKE